MTSQPTPLARVRPRGRPRIDPVPAAPVPELPAAFAAEVAELEAAMSLHLDALAGRRRGRVLDVADLFAATAKRRSAFILAHPTEAGAALKIRGLADRLAAIAGADGLEDAVDRVAGVGRSRQHNRTALLRACFNGLAGFVA